MHLASPSTPTPRTRSSALATAALAVVAGLAIGGAAPATADVGDRAHIEPAGGKYGHGSTPLVLRVDGKDERARPYLFSVKVASGATFTHVWTYCVEARVAAETEAPYTEARWSDFPQGDGDFKANATKVKWALEHSFPSLTLAQIEKQVPGTGSITESDAIAATQAAVWFWTDGATLPARADGSDQLNTRERALYDYLVGSRNDGSSEAAPTVGLTPSSGSGVDGTTIGPIVVSTTVAHGVKLTTGIPEDAAGVSLVDGAGKPVAPDALVKDGTKLFVDVPAGTAPGSVTITAGTGQVTVGGAGRIFVGSDPRVRTQTMILAAAEHRSFDTSAKVSWTKATPVVPAAVSFADTCGTKDDSFTIPATPGVEYLVDGKPVAAGTHAGSGTVTVTARATPGHVLAEDAATSWTRSFKDTSCAAPTTPVPTTTTSAPAPTPTPSETTTPPASPTVPSLPTTGSGAVLPLAAAAAGLLGLGGVLVLTTRKAKRRA